eukprot:752183-Hanusia_phi.AAC.1
MEKVVHLFSPADHCDHPLISGPSCCSKVEAEHDPGRFSDQTHSVDDTFACITSRGVICCKTTVAVDLRPSLSVFSRCYLLSDHSVKYVANNCLMLQHVDLRRSAIGEQGVISLGKNLGQLESIWLSGCEGVTDFAITRLMLSASKLVDLRIRECPRLSDDCLSAVVGSNRLVMLDLGSLAKLTEEGVVKAVRTNSCLTALNLSRCPLVGSDAVWNIGPRVQVRESNSLDWEEAASSDLPLHSTLGCPEIRVLSLSKCVQLTDSGLMNLASCKQLQELDISECVRVTDSSVIGLVRSCSLRRLILRGCKLLTDRSLRALGKHGSDLVLLDISSCTNFSDSCVNSVLLNCVRLRTFNCSCCSNLGAAALQSLCGAGEASSHALCEINVSGTRVGKDTLLLLVQSLSLLCVLVAAGNDLTEQDEEELLAVSSTRRTLSIVTEWNLKSRVLTLDKFDKLL